MNIAVVVSGGLSETILATPLLSTLRADSEESRLVLLCPWAAAVVADGLTGMDEIVPLKALSGRVGVGGIPRIWSELRRRRLDAVLLCSTELGVAVAAYFSATAQRIGPMAGAGRILLTGGSAPLAAENIAQTWLRLAAALGVLSELHRPAFEPGPDARELADSLLNSSPLADGRLLIAIAPGMGSADPGSDGERWEPERYAHLANQLALRHGAGIVLIGVAADRVVIEETRLDLSAPVVDVAGATDAVTIAAVLARCDLLIGGDTPLLHLAAAVGTPTVGLFGATDGLRFGPYGADHRVVQALAHSTVGGASAGTIPAAMDQIRVEDVLASIESTV